VHPWVAARTQGVGSVGRCAEREQGRSGGAGGLTLTSPWTGLLHGCSLTGLTLGLSLSPCSAPASRILVRGTEHLCHRSQCLSSDLSVSIMSPEGFPRSPSETQCRPSATSATFICNGLCLRQQPPLLSLSDLASELSTEAHGVKNTRTLLKQQGR
jgi:hypothetical protein